MNSQENNFIDHDDYYEEISDDDDFGHEIEGEGQASLTNTAGHENETFALDFDALPFVPKFSSEIRNTVEAAASAATEAAGGSESALVGNWGPSCIQGSASTAWQIDCPYFPCQEGTAALPAFSSGNNPSSAQTLGSSSNPSSAQTLSTGSGSNPSNAQTLGSSSNPSSAQTLSTGSGSNPSNAQTLGSSSNPSSAQTLSTGGGGDPSNAQILSTGSCSKLSSAQTLSSGSNSSNAQISVNTNTTTAGCPGDCLPQHTDLQAAQEESGQSLGDPNQPRGSRNSTGAGSHPLPHVGEAVGGEPPPQVGEAVRSEPPQVGNAVRTEPPPQVGEAVRSEPPPQVGEAVGGEPPPQVGEAVGGERPPQVEEAGTVCVAEKGQQGSTVSNWLDENGDPVQGAFDEIDSEVKDDPCVSIVNNMRVEYKFHVKGKRDVDSHLESVNSEGSESCSGNLASNSNLSLEKLTAGGGSNASHVEGLDEKKLYEASKNKEEYLAALEAASSSASVEDSKETDLAETRASERYSRFKRNRFLDQKAMQQTDEPSQPAKTAAEMALESQALSEILREVKQGAQRAKEFGALGWQKCPVPVVNKTFLRNTLVSTLREPYRPPGKRGQHHVGLKGRESRHQDNDSHSSSSQSSRSDSQSYSSSRSRSRSRSSSSSRSSHSRRSISSRDSHSRSRSRDGRRKDVWPRGGHPDMYYDWQAMQAMEAYAAEYGYPWYGPQAYGAYYQAGWPVDAYYGDPRAWAQYQAYYHRGYPPRGRGGRGRGRGYANRWVEEDVIYSDDDFSSSSLSPSPEREDKGQSGQSGGQTSRRQDLPEGKRSRERSGSVESQHVKRKKCKTTKGSKGGEDGEENKEKRKKKKKKKKKHKKSKDEGRETDDKGAGEKASNMGENGNAMRGDGSGSVPSKEESNEQNVTGKKKMVKKKVKAGGSGDMSDPIRPSKKKKLGMGDQGLKVGTEGKGKGKGKVKKKKSEEVKKKKKVKGKKEIEGPNSGLLCAAQDKNDESQVEDGHCTGKHTSEGMTPKTDVKEKTFAGCEEEVSHDRIEAPTSVKEKSQNRRENEKGEEAEGGGEKEAIGDAQGQGQGGDQVRGNAGPIHQDGLLAKSVESMKEGEGWEGEGRAKQDVNADESQGKGKSENSRMSGESRDSQVLEENESQESEEKRRMSGEIQVRQKSESQETEKTSVGGESRDSQIKEKSEENQQKVSAPQSAQKLDAGDVKPQRESRESRQRKGHGQSKSNTKGKKRVSGVTDDKGGKRDKTSIEEACDHHSKLKPKKKLVDKRTSSTCSDQLRCKDASESKGDFDLKSGRPLGKGEWDDRVSASRTNEGQTNQNCRQNSKRRRDNNYDYGEESDADHHWKKKRMDGEFSSSCEDREKVFHHLKHEIRGLDHAKHHGKERKGRSDNALSSKDRDERHVGDGKGGGPVLFDAREKIKEKKRMRELLERQREKDAALGDSSKHDDTSGHKRLTPLKKKDKSRRASRESQLDSFSGDETIKAKSSSHQAPWEKKISGKAEKQEKGKKKTEEKSKSQSSKGGRSIVREDTSHGKKTDRMSGNKEYSDGREKAVSKSSPKHQGSDFKEKELEVRRARHDTAEEKEKQGLEERPPSTS